MASSLEHPPGNDQVSPSPSYPPSSMRGTGHVPVISEIGSILHGAVVTELLPSSPGFGNPALGSTGPPSSDGTGPAA